MIILFCADPLHPRQVDEVYQAEAQAARALDIEYALVDYEALVNARDPIRAVQRAPNVSSQVLGIYRGWMLRPEVYSQLYNVLQNRGIRLINDPAAYVHCHYLPESYALIAGLTPKSVWLHTSGEVSMDEVMRCLSPFGSTPVVLKDFVKSQKHYWTEACFIPSAADREAVERVVRRFVELQGEDLNEGLVFREFVEFEPLARHSKSDIPLTMEFRLFVLDGEVLQVFKYWEEGEYQDVMPPLDLFQNVMKKIQSRFYTMDVAKRRDGEWMIVELGDAQVAGLPEHADISEFYRMLAACKAVW